MIKIVKKNHLYGIVLNRPEKRNALNLEMLCALEEAIPDSPADNGFRLFTLEGTGDVFCAGADLHLIKQLQHSDKAIEFANRLESVLKKLRNLDVPVIARVQGACMAGANGLLAVADIVIAEENTRFAFSEVKLGLVPAIISSYVLEKISFASALDVLLTGRIFYANEAKSMGLINHLSSIANWDTAWETLIGSIWMNAPRAMSNTRSMLRTGRNLNSIDAYTTYARDRFIQAAISDEAKEGITAFFEKRPAKWTVKD